MQSLRELYLSVYKSESDTLPLSILCPLTFQARGCIWTDRRRYDFKKEHFKGGHLETGQVP